jgi:hypothetical protein
MIADEERRRSRIGKCGHPFPKTQVREVNS